jgi:hypothetical protein
MYGGAEDDGGVQVKRSGFLSALLAPLGLTALPKDVAGEDLGVGEARTIKWVYLGEAGKLDPDLAVAWHGQRGLIRMRVGDAIFEARDSNPPDSKANP